MNIDAEVKKFQALSLDDKRNICIIVLDKVKDRGGLFAELYELVSGGSATEQECRDIYESAMAVLYEVEGDKIQESVDRLERVRSELKNVQWQEQQERLREAQAAMENLSILI